MLLLAPRLRLLCWDEPGRQGIQPAMSLFDLPVHKADARNERLDMGASVPSPNCRPICSELLRQFGDIRDTSKNRI